MFLVQVTRLTLYAVVLAIIALQATLGAKKVTEEDDIVAVKGVHETDLNAWQQAYDENQNLLVLLYQSDNCAQCPKVLETLTGIQGHPDLPKGLTIAKSLSPGLASKIGSQQLPSLAYLREKSHVVYDGNFEAQDILEWVIKASNTIIQRLNDDTFDAAVSTKPGAQAEAWLLAFYKETCKSPLAALESYGVRAPQGIHIAKINIHDSPKLTNQFQVTNCPEVILLKQGKAYKYQRPSLDVASLHSFMENPGESNQTGTRPEEHTHAPSVTEHVEDFIQDYLRTDIQSAVLACTCAIVTSLVFLVICCRCCCRKKAKKQSRKAKKE